MLNRRQAIILGASAVAAVSGLASGIAQMSAIDPQDYVSRAKRYASQVIAGEIPACKWVRLACERHLGDLKASRSKSYAYRFDEGAANRICLFIEQLPHTKGKWAIQRPGQDNRIKLQDWQCFSLTTLFGWLRKDNGMRRFRRAYYCLPRKNGKSLLASGIGLYMFCADEEFGAEVYSGATTEAQAWEVFRPALQMVERTERLQKAFAIKANAKSLVVEKNGSRFHAVIGKPGDGASPSCALIDEYHEHADDTLYDTMVTGMGAREQPLALVITTAGSNLAGPCFSMQSDAQKVLEQTIQDDELFAVIYSIDDGDDWSSEAALRKANPNYDVSVFGDFLKAEQQKAIRNARKQNIFKTKHLNVWVNASTAWMNMLQWRKMGDSNLRPEQFKGDYCVITLDASSKIDIAARMKLFRREIGGKDHFYAFGDYYLPEERVNAPESQHYQGWAHDGLLIATDGNVVDYGRIQEDVVEDIETYQVREFGYDPWNAAQFAQQVQSLSDATAVEIAQNTRSLSDPMKMLEALVADGRLHHDNNPVLTWMISNVVAHVDVKENIYPRKDKVESKIDGAVALIMALSRALNHQPVSTWSPQVWA